MNFKKKALVLAILTSSATFGAAAVYATPVTSQTETLPAVGHRPVAKVEGDTVIKATGTLSSGGTIKIDEFLYDDKNKDALDVNATANTLEWFLRDPASKNLTPISPKPTNKMEVEIPHNAGGKQLVAKYMLITQTGRPTEAHEYTEIIFTKINAGNVSGGGNQGEIDMGIPIIREVNIHLTSNPTDAIHGTGVANTPIVGETLLTAEVVCDAGTMCGDDAFEYQWLMDDGNGGAFSEVPGTEAKKKTFTPQHDMQGRKFKVQATPKKGVGTRNTAEKSDVKKGRLSKAPR